MNILKSAKAWYQKANAVPGRPSSSDMETLSQIGDAIATMGKQKGRERLNFFKNSEGGLSIWQYAFLWDYIHTHHWDKPES